MTCVYKPCHLRPLKVKGFSRGLQTHSQQALTPEPGDNPAPRAARPATGMATGRVTLL
jgi:hypothetical protein